MSQKAITSLHALISGDTYSIPIHYLCVKQSYQPDHHEEDVRWESRQHLRGRLGLEVVDERLQHLLQLVPLVLEHAHVVVLLQQWKCQGYKCEEISTG